MPCLTIGAAETVTSLAWLPKDPKLLVASVGNKHLKIFDMRGTVLTFLYISRCYTNKKRKGKNVDLYSASVYYTPLMCSRH